MVKGRSLGRAASWPSYGAAGVLHAEDVVDLEMGGGAFSEAGFVDAVLDIVGHGFAGTLKTAGLVHVVPEAGDTVGDEGLVEAAPPLAGAGLGEVGEDGRAGPDGADVLGAIGGFDEVVAGVAGVVGGVAYAGLTRDVEVGDDDELELLVCQDRRRGL